MIRFDKKLCRLCVASAVVAVALATASTASTPGLPYAGGVRSLVPASPVATDYYSALHVELVTNGSFQTGDMTGWTVTDWGTSGSWFATSSATGPLSGIALQPASDGTYQAVADQTAPGTHILWQDISIPPVPALVTATLKLVYWLENYNNAFADPGTLDFTVSPNQQARIDIMDPAAPIDDVGAGVLLNVFKTNVGDTTSVPPTLLVADLTAFAGQTIRLRFVEVDNQFFFNFGVDAISIDATGPLAVEETTWGGIKAAFH